MNGKLWPTRFYPECMIRPTPSASNPNATDLYILTMGAYASTQGAATTKALAAPPPSKCFIVLSLHVRASENPITMTRAHPGNMACLFKATEPKTACSGVKRV